MPWTGSGSATGTVTNPDYADIYALVSYALPALLLTGYTAESPAFIAYVKEALNELFAEAAVWDTECFGADYEDISAAYAAIPAGNVDTANFIAAKIVADRWGVILRGNTNSGKGLVVEESAGDVRRKFAAPVKTGGSSSAGYLASWPPEAQSRFMKNSCILAAITARNQAYIDATPMANRTIAIGYCGPCRGTRY